MVADRSSNSRIIFPDATREHDAIDTPERHTHPRELLGSGIAEHVDGEGCVGARVSPSVEVPQVCRDAGYAQQAALLIDQCFERRRVEFVLPREIHQHTGVEVATARAHDDSAGRGQAHAGVNRPTLLHRGDARTIAEMRNE